MSKTREEAWGSIEYDPDLDEFEAQVCVDSPTVAVDRPLSAGCLVTGRCNLRCDFCYGNDESLPKEELTLDQWAQVFAHMRSWGLMRVDLSGGEPTIRPDIADIARAASAAGLNVVLSTNGLVLHKTGPGRLPREARIHVSIDSGFTEVHEASRRLRSLLPSSGSLEKTGRFIQQCVREKYRLRVLTCLGTHNRSGLFQLGEYIASLGVKEWNLSRILPAGRAQGGYEDRWLIEDESVMEQIQDMRYAYPWMRIRYSNRTEQDGYFLLVLPDGSLATQYTDGRDKVVLGRALEMSLDDLRDNPHFHLARHVRKWIAAAKSCQHAFCDTPLAA